MTSSLARWADDHRAAALDLVRMYLGLGLLVRGLLFLSEPASYVDLLPGGAESPYASVILAHYVGLSHVGGGLLLMLGLLTRVAALVQVPVLAGAALLVHLPAAGVFSESFAFTAFVAVLLGVFVVWGGGPWSLDQAVGRWGEATASQETARGESVARELRSRPRPAASAAARPPVPALAASDPACACGHDRDHSSVDVERAYGGFRGLRFLTGTHPLPTSVAFRCRDCRGVVEVVSDPDALEALRYESAG